MPANFELDAAEGDVANLEKQIEVLKLICNDEKYQRYHYVLVQLRMGLERQLPGAHAALFRARSRAKEDYKRGKRY